MSLKSLADRETKVYTELVRSLNRDDITVAEIEQALEKRRTIISMTPSRLPVEARLSLFRETIFNELFVGSDVQIKRRMSGELNHVLFRSRDDQ